MPPDGIARGCTAARPRLFEDQVVLVVGGGRGLGRAYCLDLAEQGARVAVGGRSATADDVTAEIRHAGGEAAVVRADVRDGDALAAGAVAAFGRIDALIVNAGVTADRSFGKMRRHEWDEVIDIHLDGAYSCARACWNPLRKGGGGAILLTTSGAGLYGAFGQANYAAAKGGVVGLARTLAIEGARCGIRVNAIAPMASTAMTAEVFSTALKQGLRVEDVSPFALGLIHPDCRLTGQVIEAGGGWGAAMRWERSRGRRFVAPDVAAVLSHWDAITDFGAGSDLPETTLDSLAAASGRERTMRQPA